MKLFELKRFFVVMLLVCLGIGQSWAQSSTGTVGFTVDRNNQVTEWPANADGISCRFEDTKGTLSFYEGAFGNTKNDAYQLGAYADVDFVWSNTDPNQHFIRVKSINVTNDIVYLGTIKPDNKAFIKCNYNNSEQTNSTTHATTPEWNGSFTYNGLSDIVSDGQAGIKFTTGVGEHRGGFLNMGYSTIQYEIQSITVSYEKLYFYKAKASVANAADSDHGTVKIDGNPDQETYTLIENENFQFKYVLEATPEDGWAFVGWSEGENGDIVSNNPNYEVTIDCNKSNHNKPISKNWYAHYTKLYNYSATAKVETVGHGSATVEASGDVKGINVNNGGTTSTQSVEDPITDTEKTFTFQLSATPNDGLLFAGWYNSKGEKVSVKEQDEVTITCNPENEKAEDTWTAHFDTPRTLYAAVDIQVKKNADDPFDGTVSGGDMQQFATGAESYPFDFTLSATGSDTYEFVGWSEKNNWEDITLPEEPYVVTVNATSERSDAPTTKDVYAYFKRLRTYSATVKVMSVLYEYGKEREEPILRNEETDTYHSEPLDPTTDESHIFNFTGLTAPTIDGYTFMGWSESASAEVSDFVKGDSDTYSTDVESTKDDLTPEKEVYAFFKKKITYSAAVNVEKVSDSNVEITGTITGYDQQTHVTEEDDHTFTFNLKATGNEDYDFKGWATSEANAQAGIYIATSANYSSVEVPCTAAKPAETLTLYAYFKHRPLHYSKVILKAIGNGNVAIVGSDVVLNDNNAANNLTYKKEDFLDQSTKSSDTETTHKYGRLALATQGSVFVGWFKDEAATEMVGEDNSRTDKFDLSTNSLDASDPVTATYYAKFVPVYDYVEAKISEEGYTGELANELLNTLKNYNAVSNAYLPNGRDFWQRPQANTWSTQPKKSDLDNLKFVGLDEMSYDNSDVVNGTYSAVVVKRELKTGIWNTFCLPFEIRKSVLGNNPQVKYLGSVTIDEEGYNLNFVDENYETGGFLGLGAQATLRANRPYIVKVNTAMKFISVTDVKVDNGTPETNINAQKVSFIGSYDVMDIPKSTEENSFYIIQNNNFYYVNDPDVKIKGFRGYFKIEGNDTPTSNPSLNASFDNDATGITTVNSNRNDDKLYNIAGQRVKENAKGIVIKNGKKFFVK